MVWCPRCQKHVRANRQKTTLDDKIVVTVNCSNCGVFLKSENIPKRRRQQQKPAHAKDTTD